MLLLNEFLSLDETHYPTNIGAAFKTMRKSKPAKYGLLLKSLNDAETAYTCN